MLLKEYTDACIEYSKATINKADPLNFVVTTKGAYKNHPLSTVQKWIELVDNEHRGLDVSWACGKSTREIRILAPQMFINRVKDEILTAIDDDAEPEELIKIVQNLMEV